MKTIYVNKEGVICACTQAVPNYPEKPGPMSHQQFFTEYYEDDLPTYDIMLKACKESAVPFEDINAVAVILLKQLRKGKELEESVMINIQPDTFYQIEADWEIVEIPWAEIDHQPGSTALMASTKMVARLKVPAPTVATDNSGELNFNKPDFKEAGRSTWRKMFAGLTHPGWDKEIEGYASNFDHGAEFVWQSHIKPLHSEVDFWKKAFHDEQKRADELRMKIDSVEKDILRDLMEDNAELKAFITKVLHSDGFTKDTFSVRAIELLSGVRIKDWPVGDEAEKT